MIDYREGLVTLCECGCGTAITPVPSQWHSRRRFVDRAHYNKWKRDRAAEKREAPTAGLCRCGCGLPTALSGCGRPTNYATEECRRRVKNQRRSLREHGLKADRLATHGRLRRGRHGGGDPSPEKIAALSAQVLAEREHGRSLENGSLRAVALERRELRDRYDDAVDAIGQIDWPEDL